jgi:RsiW-degrading membrane proteinase PrsW (M82 family)
MEASVTRTLALDRRTSVMGAASIAFAVLAAIAGWAGLVPSSGATVLVILAAAIVLRVAWSYVAKASSPASARVVQLVSNVGLGVSVVTLLAVLPRITAVGGVPLMLTDTAAQLWTLALLTLAGYGVRTFGWRVYAGTFLTGFLALTGLARFIGRPLIERFGTSDAAIVGLWVPFTEEAIKLIPVAVVLFAALRRSDRRPSALDVMLLGAWAGAGFAIYESATFGRGTFSLTAAPVISLFFPMAGPGRAFDWPIVQVGHLIHSALLALGIGFFFLYRKRVRRAWIAPAVAVFASLLEHTSQNAILTGAVPEFAARATIVLTAGGYLSSIALIAGVVYIAVFETRAVGWVDVKRRPALLAAAQAGNAR